MAVGGCAGLGPRLERLIQTSNTIPVKERSRIEKYDRGGTDTKNHCEIDPSPSLLCRLRVRDVAYGIGNRQDRNRKDRAGEMDGVGLLGQNHAGYSHSGIPEVIQPTKFPQAEQSRMKMNEKNSSHNS